MVAALALGLLVQGLPVLAQSQPSSGTVTELPDEDSGPPGEHADAASAVAVASGHRVEITSQRGETSTTWANPDGTFTTVRYAGPVRVFDESDRSDGAEGSWRSIDTALVDVGSWVQPVTSAAEMRFSDGGSGPAARMDIGTRSLQLGWEEPLPTPVLDGSVVTYADVEPGVDLQYEALPAGFRQLLVLEQRSSQPPVFGVPLDLQGLDASQHDGGRLELDTPGGRTLVTSDQAVMWDARTVDLDGDDPSHYAPVTTRVLALGH